MPRNGSGTFTLVTGNPVVSGTIIESTWANSTLADIADSITNSLARNGEGGMTAPLRLTDGVVGTPSLAFANETSSGLYRAAAGDLGLAVLGNRILRLQAAGASVTGTLNVSSTASIGGDIDVNGAVFRQQAAGTGYLVYGSNGATNNGLYYDQANSAVSLWTVSNQRLTINSSGNVGIGVTPSAWNSNRKAIQTGNASFVSAPSVPAFMQVSANAYTDSGGTDRYISTAASTNYAQVNGAHQWFTAPSGTAGNAISFTQAMTLDASGNLLVGTLAAIGNGKVSVKGTAGLSAMGVQVGADGNYGIQFQNAANANAGFIQVNTSSTTYSTSSDYRLKENIEPMTGALDKVAALKPCTYTWKTDGSAGQGFIAHELQAVVPDCVTGEKDAVETVDDLDAEGKKIGTKTVPRYQGVDTSFLVATLVAAIQELKAEVDALKSVPAA
jgi:hypothetical protein